MSLRDLFIKIGIGVEGHEKVERAESALKSLKDHAERLKTALEGVGVALGVRELFEFTQSVIENAASLEHQSQMLGISTDELQRWTYAASQTGVDAEAAAKGLKFLNKNVGLAALGDKEAVKHMRSLGVGIKDAGGNVRPTTDILADFSDKLAALPNQQERTALATKLLGREGAALLPVLQNGSQALRDMYADVEELGGGFSEDLVKSAHETEVQEKRLAFAWKSASGQLLKSLLPAIKTVIDYGIKVVKLFIEWAKNTHAVQAALAALGTIAVGIAVAIAAAWAPEIAIFTALYAAVYAVYLIFDDFYTFLRGGQSVIGDSLDSAGIDSKALAGTILDAFNKVGETFGNIGNVFKNFDQWFIESIPKMAAWSGKFIIFVVEVIDDAISGLRYLGTLVSDVFAMVLDPLHASGGLAQLKADLKGTAQTRANDVRHEQLERVNDALTQIGNAKVVPQATVVPDELYKGPVANPSERVGFGTRVPEGGGNVTHETHNNVTVHVNAAGATNPAAVGNAVGKGVRQGLKNPDSTNRNTYDAISPVAGVGN
jgi:hypothetical protein